MDEKLWVRAGDGDDYHGYEDDLGAVAEYLFEMGAINDLRRAGESGMLAGTGFEGQNYISLYWGEDVEDLSRGLNEEEITALNDFIDDLIEENEEQ